MRPLYSLFGTLALMALTFAPSGESLAKAPQLKGKGNLLKVGASVPKGAKDALITIVEFSDFQCPFCSRVNPTIKKLLEKYPGKLRVVFKHNPLSFHKDAPYASKATIAAGFQGKFWEMHDILFKNQRKLKPEQIEGYAKEIGLDVVRLKKDIESKQVSAQLAADQAMARSVGARGTPNFRINGHLLSGAQPFPKFVAVIDKELPEAQKLKAAGKSTEEIYAQRVKANFKMPPPRKPRAGNNSKTVYKLPLSANSAVKGGKTPLVTIVEFSEFQCPFCSRVNPTIKKILDTYGDKVQIRFRHNTLPFHKNAKGASKAALAAKKQGKFWEMHDILFKNQRKLEAEKLTGYAKQVGLDLTRFEADMKDPALDKIIAQDMKIAQQFGARGTPNFFINGRQVTGARPFESFKTIIDEEIKKADLLIKKGTPRDQIYAQLTAKGATKAVAPARQPRKKRDPLADKTVYKVPLGANYTAKGPETALVTIVEFSEFQCPFCSRVGPTLKKIEKEYGKDVRIVFKHNPLPFHKDAKLAAQAALSAGAQGKFWPMHDILFKNQRALKRENLEKFAQELGLNMAAFKADLDSGKYAAQIDADQKLARSIGAGGTPNFFINGRKLVGAQPFENFKKLIDAEMKKARALLAKGIAPQNIYAESIKAGVEKPSKRAVKPIKPTIKPLKPAVKPIKPIVKPIKPIKPIVKTIKPVIKPIKPIVKPAKPVKVDPKKSRSKVSVNAQDHFKGNPQALINIVMFSEFQCPFSKRVNSTIDKIMGLYSDKVRVIFKHKPLSFHKDAPLASQAALAAGAQGKFWQMHDLLFQNQNALKRPDLEKYAQQLGLNMSTFKATLDSGKYVAQIAADKAESIKLGVRGTPSLFINGRNVRGAQPFETFKKIIDEELKALKSPMKVLPAPKRLPVLKPLHPVKPLPPIKPVPALKPEVAVKPPSKIFKPKKLNPKLLKAKGPKLSVGESVPKGAKDALITIIEFSDFQCPFCSKVNPTIKKLLEKYPGKLRVVFKHNPLSFHKDAPYASKAAIAAGFQGKFWEMHDILFKNQRKLKPEQIEGYAKEIGLDIVRFKKDAESKKVAELLAADMAMAKLVGARGTPNFRINGLLLSGAQPFPKFVAVIDKELPEAQKLKAAGKSTEEIYAQRVKANFKMPPPRKPRPKKDNKTVYKLPLSANSAVKGGKAPLVTIVEFSEFQCPFCSRVNPTIKKILDTYGDKVQIRFRHNTLPFHKNAKGASKAALAAKKQGKFWEMHDILFKNQRKLEAEKLTGYAKQVGLDLTRFEADMKDPALDKIIAQDMKIAQQFGARGTPNFFINGRQVTGARPFESFKTIIDEEIKKADLLIKKGTPRDQIYAQLTAKGATKAVAPARQPRKKRDPLADKTVYKVPLGANYTAKGPETALVTIVEFSEFQCPFCSRVGPTLKKIEKEYGKDVRIVFKHNPLPFHKDAKLAAQAALSAGAQGKFWPMHDILFKNQRALKRENLEKFAQELGLNMAAFKADLDSGKYAAQIDADQKLARSIGAGGTPNFFINGRKLVGAQPFESFQKLIDAEMKKARALVAKGIAPNKVYEESIKNGVDKPVASRRKPAAEDKTVYQVAVSPNDYFKGNAKAKVTIVEFSEFQCPFCSRVNPTMKKIMESYGDKVKIVFKHNPLPFHKDAPLASEAALAAGAQGKFWPMHDLLFKNQRKLKRENLDTYAQELGLNLENFKAALDSGKYKAQVAADQAQAKKLKASGTPTFFINGRKIRGAQPFENFKKLIDAELK